MSTHTGPWDAGVPCWTDLSTPDVAGARTFYRAVLGWDVTEPDEAFGGYVMGMVGESPAAGIGPAQPGAPTAWTLYFASTDAEASSAAITEHGGTVLTSVMDVGSLGRMVVAADPTGAIFGIWQGVEFPGAAVYNEPGGIAWEDLRSTDPDAARAFYGAVFGFDFHPLADAGPDYTTFCPAGSERPLGGMGGMMGQEGMPSQWIVYFGVADLDAATAAAEQNGGAILMRDLDTPFGRMAAVTDPQGATFWLHQAPPTES